MMAVVVEVVCLRAEAAHQRCSFRLCAQGHHFTSTPSGRLSLLPLPDLGLLIRLLPPCLPTQQPKREE